jgi:uncharacterized tellurite resistance protein B-like protein
MDEKLKSHMRSLYCMAASDDNVSPEELTTMYEIGVNKFGLSPEEINEAVLSGGTTIYIPETEEEKVEYLFHLTQIALADGSFDENEKFLIKKYALKFGIIENQVDDLIDLMVKTAGEGKDIKEQLK